MDLALNNLQRLICHSWRENKGVHTFPKGICPKVNVIARLEYELAYYDSAVHRFNHYTTRTPINTTRMVSSVCTNTGIADEFVLVSLTVFGMSCLSYFNGL